MPLIAVNVPLSKRAREEAGSHLWRLCSPRKGRALLVTASLAGQLENLGNLQLLWKGEALADLVTAGAREGPRTQTGCDESLLAGQAEDSSPARAAQRRLAGSTAGRLFLSPKLLQEEEGGVLGVHEKGSCPTQQMQSNPSRDGFAAWLLPSPHCPLPAPIQRRKWLMGFWLRTFPVTELFQWIPVLGSAQPNPAGRMWDRGCPLHPEGGRQEVSPFRPPGRAATSPMLVRPSHKPMTPVPGLSATGVSSTRLPHSAG